jgi:hypothetical protein
MHINISLCGADMMGILSSGVHFFNSFPLETDFFFCNFRIKSRVQNRKQSDESKQYNFSATLIEEINQNKYEKTNRHPNAQ